MEGKAVLFKAFGSVDAFPICIDSKDVDEIVETVERIAPVFGGINLEDISSPRCVEIEERLKKSLDIPVFHDDQHGTAVVVTAALINALRLVGKEWKDVTVAMSGAGAAGYAVSLMLSAMNVKDIFVCNSKEILQRDVHYDNDVYNRIAAFSNREGRTGHLAEAMRGADIFIGVSKKGIVSKEMAASMAEGAIILAMANPDPEIMPEDALDAGARIVGTGRSDFANQINNVVAFPGIFRGALDAGASDINEAMKIAAAKALADLIGDDERSENYIIVPAFDPRVESAVSKAVKEAAQASGVARTFA
jgi:malate dehydrogenase (oxaloacetate-decarboxylating)